MINLYQLSQMRGLLRWPVMLFRVVTACVEPATGPLGANISASRLKLHFQKFRNVI